MRYVDADGNPCTLQHLCITDPDWAATRIAVMQMKLDAIEDMLRHNVCDTECGYHKGADGHALICLGCRISEVMTRAPR